MEQENKIMLNPQIYADVIMSELMKATNEKIEFKALYLQSEQKVKELEKELEELKKDK